jgi:hypothetical protein
METTPQEPNPVAPQLSLPDEIFNAVTAVLRDLKWEDDVCINLEGDGGDISVSYVEVSVSVSMCSRIAADAAHEIVRRLLGEY